MFRPLPLLIALLFAGVSVDASAIYLPPDLMQIPAERIAKNLERSLKSAKTPAAKRGIQMQLARIYAAAYAQKDGQISVHTPIEAMPSLPTVKGARTPAEVSTAFAYIGGRGRPLYGVLSSDLVKDDALGCVPERLTEIASCLGEVVVSYRIPPKATTATDIKVTTSTIGHKEVEACLRSYIARAEFQPATAPTTVTQKYTFGPANFGGAPFYGFGDVTVPRMVSPASDDTEKAQARVYLEKARAAYYAVVKTAPDNALAHLGLAWTIEQRGDDGDKEKAITCYRKAFEIAWKTEQNLTFLGLGAQPIAAEAAGYLMPLLDPDTDKEELTRLAEAQLQLNTLNRPVTPIVVPLDDTATLASLVDPSASVAFDLDGSGVAKRWGWIRPNAAWLVYDEGDTGQIGSALQLFGSVSFWTFWSDGYQALAALDDNGDGALTGAELRHLALWADTDGDGVSTPAEVRPVAAHGITSLRYDANPDANGVLSVPAGVTLRDGTQRPTWDWVVAPNER